MMLFRFALLALLLCIVSADYLRSIDSNEVSSDQGRRLTEANKADCHCHCKDRVGRPGKCMNPSTGDMELAVHGGRFCERNDRVMELIKEGKAECAHDCDLVVEDGEECDPKEECCPVQQK